MSAELEKAKSNLEKAEKLQEIMKKANAIIRAGKDVTTKLVEAGLSQDQAEKIQQPDFAKRVGFPSFRLTNNNATIKRLKDRVNQLESKETASTAGEERYMFEGGSVEVNYTDDRVQILYDAIPTKEQRDQLKSNGWKWSPKNTAWQRKITPQAISNAKYLTGATGAAPVQEQTGPIDTDDLLKKRKFSYVTINLYGALPADYTGSKSFELVYFDVISANIVEAIRAYFKENLPEIASELIKVSVYTKTYVKESQRLVDQNRFLPNDAPAKIVLGPGLQQIKDFFANKPEPVTTPEPEPAKEETIDSKEKYIQWKQQIFGSEHNTVIRQNAMRLPEQGDGIDYQKVADVTKKIIESGKETDPKVASGWAEQLVLSAQWMDPEFSDLRKFATTNKAEAVRMLADYDQFGIEVPADIRDLIISIEPEKREIVKKTYAVTRKGYDQEMWKEAEDKQDAIYLVRKSLHGTWGKWFPESHFTARLVPEKEVEAHELELETERNEEFDQTIMENLNPHDGWVGNIIKERVVRKQIYDQLTGPETEKEAAVSRIFDKYKTSVTPKVQPPPEAKDFIREHFVFATVPPHGPKFKTFEQHGETFAKNNIAKNQDNAILSRYPKLSKQEVVNVYNQVEGILGKEDYTAEDKYILEKYEGLGSQTATGIIDKGLLHQFYTPYIIAKKMWELGFIYGAPKENPIVIEPSMGTGRFFKYAPAGSTCIGFDPDKKNIEIAKILYPNITVYQQEFETAFLEAPRYNRMAKKSWLPEADLCIGNPPYGDYMGYYKSYMPSAFKRFEFLFIYLGLKTLKQGGLLVFIVSQNFMNNGAMYNGMKAKILELGEFVDSIRLPNGIFSSTDVGTDIVIFRKK